MGKRRLTQNLGIYIIAATFAATSMVIGFNCSEVSLKHASSGGGGGGSNPGTGGRPPPGGGPVTWSLATGQGNPGESCHAWLTRTGQVAGSKKVTYSLNGSSNPAFQNVTVGNACTYIAFWSGSTTSGVCGYFSSESPPPSPFGSVPVASCVLFSGETLSTSIAAGDAAFTTGTPPFENGWRLASGQSNNSEGCIAWLDRTAQRTTSMAPESSIRTIYFGVINPEIWPTCEGKTTSGGSTICGRDRNMTGGFANTVVVGDCISDSYGNYGPRVFSTQVR